MENIISYFWRVRGIKMDDQRFVYRKENIVVVSEFIDDNKRYNTLRELISLAIQVCARFKIKATDLKLIEHSYDAIGNDFHEIVFDINEDVGNDNTDLRIFSNPKRVVVSIHDVNNMMTV